MNASLPSRTSALTRLHAALATFNEQIEHAVIDGLPVPGGPGQWLIRDQADHGGYCAIALTYRVLVEPHAFPAPHHLLQDGDEPWTLWHGSALLQSAGLDLREADIENYPATLPEDPRRTGVEVFEDVGYIEVADDAGQL
jgi:hypothetical protein